MPNEIERLAARLQHFEDLEEIKSLKRRYCLYCDGGWPRQGGSHRGPVADLFVEDGVWDASPGLPIARGRDAIRKLFEDLRAIPFALHPVTNPLIKINGDTATGHWNLISCSTPPGGVAGLYVGGYEEEYVRTPEGWRYRLMRVFIARRATLVWEEIPDEGSWTPAMSFGNSPDA